jgi:acetyl-CoA C-acetyltransferase
MSEVVIVEAVRTPFGKRGGALAEVHPADLLATVLRAVVDRAGIDPGSVGQVVGGCIDQVGEQAMNVTRTGWLVAGFPEHVAQTTIDSQCGSSQQALTLAAGLVGSGIVDVAIACGVESMTRVPMLCTLDGPGHPAPPSYHDRYGEFVLQQESGERIARKWGISRAETDALGLESQRRAQRAWAEGRFESQIAPVGAVERDQGLRETSADALTALKPVHPDGGVHTAGSASQITDGASAVLITTAERAAELGLRVRARIVDSVLVGSDPILMLTGPIPATQALLERNDMRIDDIDVIEINEAFASVVLAWQREIKADMDRVNPNGGAIALGHPLGATGTALITKAVHELERTGGRHALVTICCGGGLGTGTLIERI